MAERPHWPYWSPGEEMQHTFDEPASILDAPLVTFYDMKYHLHGNREKKRYNEWIVSLNRFSSNTMYQEGFVFKATDTATKDSLKKIILLKVHEKLHSELQSDVELLTSCLAMINGQSDENVDCAEKIADILYTAEWKLYDVICLQCVELTKAFLQKFHERNKSNDHFDQRKCLREDHDDSAIVVDQLMNFLDLRQLEVVLEYGLGQNFRTRHFFRNLASMATQNQNLSALKIFVDEIAKWDILEVRARRFIELEVFFKAQKQVIQVFMQSKLYHMVNVYGRSVLAAVFGNPNIKIGFLTKKKKFNVNVMGGERLTALHYAAENRNIKKIKYLLNHGAEPNSQTFRRTTPLSLVLWNCDVKPIESGKCAEQLLQYGADLFLFSSDWKMFNCCMVWSSWHTNWNTVRDEPFESVGDLSKLVLAYICIHEAAGMRDISFRLSTETRVDKDVRENDSMFNFYSRCHRELQILKGDEIRGNVTMFTILCETGRKLIRLINEEDCKIIHNFMNKYSNETTLNRYYLNALREHMRQLRKIVFHKNRAMFVISTSIEVLAPYFVVLKKIVSCLTYENLLMFQ